MGASNGMDAGFAMPKGRKNSKFAGWNLKEMRAFRAANASDFEFRASNFPPEAGQCLRSWRLAGKD
jgi:hypothetical protein